MLDKEFEYFSKYAVANSLTSAMRVLWYGLIFIAYMRDWPSGYYQIHMWELVQNTGLSAETIRRTRKKLQKAGLLNYITDGMTYYKLHYLSIYGAPAAARAAHENGANQ